MRLTREAKLGLTAIIAIIIFVWGLNFLKARSLFNKNLTFYGVYSQVDGLKISSSVLYRGYTVGQVRSINFVGKHYEQVLVEFSVTNEIQIPNNTIAAITSVDLMGSKAIDLIPGNSIIYAKDDDTLTTRVDLGIMQQVNEQIAPLKLKAENILSSLDTILTSIQGILDGKVDGEHKGGIGSVNRTLDNIEQLTHNLNILVADETKNIATIIENINSVTTNLKDNNTHITQTLSNVAEISDSLKAANMKATLQRVNHILASIDTMTMRLNNGEGTMGKILNKEELYYDLTAISENLNKILIDLQNNPKKYISFSVFSKTPKEYDTYNVVIFSSIAPLSRDSELYYQNVNLKEIRLNGEYIYIDGSYKRLNQAQKQLQKLKTKFPKAYIVKLSEISK